MDRASPHLNPNNILLLPVMNKEVVGMARVRILNLAIMPRCLVDFMVMVRDQGKVLMFQWEVIHTMDSSIKASSLLDHHPVNLEVTLEQDTRASREGGNLTIIARAKSFHSLRDWNWGT